MSQAHPHLIFEGFNTKLGTRVGNILKYLFPCTKDESTRTCSFVTVKDHICFRHHCFEKDRDTRQVVLKEQGPRFDLRLYQIKLGTVDQTWAENEWVLRPFQNSQKQKL